MAGKALLRLHPLVLLVATCALFASTADATSAFLNVTWPTVQGAQVTVVAGTTVILRATTTSNVSIGEPDTCGERARGRLVRVRVCRPSVSFSLSFFLSPPSLPSLPSCTTERFTVAQLSVGQVYSFTPFEPGAYEVFHNGSLRLAVEVTLPPSLKCPNGSAPIDMCVPTTFTPFSGCGAVTTKSACTGGCVWRHGLCIDSLDSCVGQSRASCSERNNGCQWLGCVPTSCGLNATANLTVECGAQVSRRPLCGNLFSRGCVLNGTRSCVPLVHAVPSLVSERRGGGEKAWQESE
jgi:hypothetical protein